MKIQNTDVLNMVTELFTDTPWATEAVVPPGKREQYVCILAGNVEHDDKIMAMNALLGLSRAKRIKNAGIFSAKNASDLISAFATLIGTPVEITAGEKLMKEAGYCEGAGDYQGAFWLYEGCFKFKTDRSDVKYFRLNNLGFCLLYLRKFREAEPCLRSATELQPKLYNAWKNLGISLEHQGKAEDAAKCYIQAINLSNAEGRSLKHLLRLISRHQELRCRMEVQGCLDSLTKTGIIPKAGRA